MKKLIVLLFILLSISTPLYAVEYDANADGKIDIGYLPVGTSLQAYDPDLVAIAALTCTENQIIKRNGSGTWICADDSASMTYPGAGIAKSTGSAWDTSYAVGTEAGTIAAGDHAHSGTYQPADADIPTVAASQVEMEAGTEAGLRSMSPLRVAQAIAALAGEGTDTIGWAYTALTEAPTGGALIAGKVYRANNEAGGWDPITYAGTDDYFVLWTGSAWVGLIDINGNWLLSSTSLLTAAAPTIDAAGEVAIDTTSDQLVYYGGAKRAIPYKQYVSAVIPAPADTDDINLLKAPYGMTILAINCIVQGTTSVTGQLQECDSAGANCADLDSDITCDADGAADDGTLTDSAIASSGWLRWKTTSVSGTPTFLTVTATYSVVSD